MMVLRAVHLLVPSLLVVFGLSHARADETRGLVTIGMQRLFEEVTPGFEAATRQKVNVAFASTPDIVRRVQSGERADFVVTSRAGIEILIRTGQVTAGNDFVIVASVIAMAVPAGRPKPDISTVAAFTSALLSAHAISYTDPSSGGPSGVHLKRVGEELGITDQVSAKTKFPPAGGAVGAILARGEADIGIQQMSELSSLKGVDVVGPLPRGLQSVTEYAVAIPANANHPEVGRAPLKYMHSPQGVAATKARGLDPR